MVEYPTVSRKVAGSSPVSTAYRKRSIGVVTSFGMTVIGGSNPSFLTTVFLIIYVMVPPYGGQNKTVCCNGSI